MTGDGRHRSPRLRSGFIDGFARGPRFATAVLPPEGISVRGRWLQVQALGDEAHFARRVVLRQAMRLARDGWTTLVVDLFGCGDSPGELHEATPELWRDDLIRAAAIARGDGGLPFVVGAHRAGVLLAADLLSQPGVRCDGFVAWAPVLRGRDWWAGWQRLARLAALTRNDASGESAPDPVTDGEAAVWLAGERIAVSLKNWLIAREALPREAPLVPVLHVFDAALPGNAVADPVAAWAERWQALGGPAVVHPVRLPAFWAAMDPVDVDDAIEATASALMRWPAVDGTPTDDLPAMLDSSLGTETFRERALAIPGRTGPLSAVLTLPAGQPLSSTLLMIPGQPQTRVGPHRLYALLARTAAAAGFASLRLDPHGWGDSPGEAEAIAASVPDAVAAAQALRTLGLDRSPVICVGLCDGATVALLAHPLLESVLGHPPGLALINPWIRDEAAEASAQIRGHYLARLASGDFWNRLMRGEVRISRALSEATRAVLTTARAPEGHDDAGVAADAAQWAPAVLEQTLARRDVDGVLVLSGRDLTAVAFEAWLRRDVRRAADWLDGHRLLRFDQADHTFSGRHVLPAVLPALVGKLTEASRRIVGRT